MPGINFDLYVGRHLISILLALKGALVTYSLFCEMNQRFRPRINCCLIFCICRSNCGRFLCKYITESRHRLLLPVPNGRIFRFITLRSGAAAPARRCLPLLRVAVQTCHGGLEVWWRQHDLHDQSICCLPSSLGQQKTNKPQTKLVPNLLIAVSDHSFNNNNNNN